MAKYKVWAFDPGKSNTSSEIFQLIAFAKGYGWSGTNKQVVKHTGKIFVDCNARSLYFCNFVVPGEIVTAYERALYLFDNPPLAFPYQMVKDGFQIEFNENGSVEIDNGHEGVLIPSLLFEEIRDIRQRLQNL